MTDPIDTNCFGFTPCPNCRGKYRCEFNNMPGVLQCDDCGYKEPVTKYNSLLFEDEAILDS